jgi:HTH-type transcriptional regulator/antitoxin HigA
MDATLILIDSHAELARARALVDRIRASEAPADIARLHAQAHLIAAYEDRKWPRRPPSTADLIRHLTDQHNLTRADVVPILGTPSRASEVLEGKKELSMAMVQRLRARFQRSRRPAASTPPGKRRPHAGPNAPQRDCTGLRGLIEKKAQSAISADLTADHTTLIRTTAGVPAIGLGATAQRGRTVLRVAERIKLHRVGDTPPTPRPVRTGSTSAGHARAGRRRRGCRASRTVPSSSCSGRGRRNPSTTARPWTRRS